tara:strand:+ start:26210 stop:26575 length:366 start_codon:yes stop_codon:yes gene_type:complete
MNKEELLLNVKKWILIDDEIKKLSNIARERRKEKRDITNILVDTMKDNEIDCFDLAGGNKLIYTKNKGKKALSKTHLINALTKFYKDDKIRVKELSQYILESRDDNITENIKRKAGKKNNQ